MISKYTFFIKYITIMNELYTKIIFLHIFIFG